MTGSHSHRGSGAFQNTQNTHDTLHQRDHADSADYTRGKKSISTGEPHHGGDGKGTVGGMPDVIAKDLKTIKSGEAPPPGGSDADSKSNSREKTTD
jgi:hypothetical protein